MKTFKMVASVHEEKMSKAWMWTSHREVRSPGLYHSATVAELRVELIYWDECLRWLTDGCTSPDKKLC